MMFQPTERQLEPRKELEKARTQEERDRINAEIKEELKKDDRFERARKQGFC